MLNLYNCQPDYAEPDWTQWDHLEISGCVDLSTDLAETCITAGQSAGRAQFFSIYGRQHADADGIMVADAITDCADATEVLSVAAALARISGLPVKLDANLEG